MGSGKIALGMLLFIGALMFVANWHQEQKSEVPGFEAQLIAESLFEDVPFWTKTEFKRLIYEYPRDQIPPDATFFTVNITIPDPTADQLDQLAAQYPNLKEAFYPRVYAAETTGVNEFSYYRPFAILYVEKTPNGVPKKIQVKFKTSDVPSNAKYLVVTFHVPFFEDWDDNSPFCFQSTYDTDPEGQWTAVKLEKPICIEGRYDRNTWTSWKILNEQQDSEGWSVLVRDLNMPIDPYKPLMARWLVDYYENSYEGGGQFVLGLKFELDDGSTYFVAIRAFVDHPLADLADYRGAFSGIEDIDCAFTIDTNDELLDLSGYIQQNCDIDWNRVRNLKQVYIALRDERRYVGEEGHTLLSYLFIGHPDFIAAT